jgi:hypothetical protein
MYTGASIIRQRTIVILEKGQFCLIYQQKQGAESEYLMPFGRLPRQRLGIDVLYAKKMKGVLAS